MTGGRDYIALVRFSDKDDVTLVDVGQRCDALTPEALAWAIRTGRVRHEPAPVKKGAR